MPLTHKLTWNKTRVKKNGETRVYLRITIDRDVKPMKLDFYWPADKINEEKGILNPRYLEDPDVQRRNLQVKNKVNDITDIETQYSLRRKILTIPLLFRDIGFYKRRMTLTQWMKFKIDERFNDGEIEESTKKNGLSTVESLKEFRTKIYIDEVNKGFLSKYAAWLQKGGSGPGNIWSRIKDIKAYLHWAEQEVMLVVDADYKNYSNTAPDNETVFLNQRELNLLFDLVDGGKLTGTQRRVLMAFLFQCTTSLRISDVYNANSDWILDSRMLQFIPKKGAKRRNKRLVVPIMPGAKLFINNLQGKFFTLPTQQEYNRTLKEIAGIAGIHKNLTSHVGRHTYGYLFMKYIKNVKALQMILGHSSVNVTQRYAHLEDDDLFDAVMDMQREMNLSLLKKA